MYVRGHVGLLRGGGGGYGGVGIPLRVCVLNDYSEREKFFEKVRMYNQSSNVSLIHR